MRSGDLYPDEPQFVTSGRLKLSHIHVSVDVEVALGDVTLVG